MENILLRMEARPHLHEHFFSAMSPFSDSSPPPYLSIPLQCKSRNADIPRRLLLLLLMLPAAAA